MLKLRFSRALTHYAQQTQRNAAQAAPPPPGSQRMETEDARRKRKFAEMLSDEGGGIQAELGVHEVSAAWGESHGRCSVKFWMNSSNLCLSRPCVSPTIANRLGSKSRI